MFKKSGNIYLDALEYGEKQLVKRQGVTRKQLQRHLENKGYKFSTKEEVRLLDDLAREEFFIFIGDNPDLKYYLNVEGYFKLLEYRELSEARKSSVEARLFALIAIVLSFVALLVSIYFSNMELNQKTTIEDEQFNVIKNIQQSLESAGSKKHNKY